MISQRERVRRVSEAQPAVVPRTDVRLCCAHRPTRYKEEAAMSEVSGPPFRADHVGSLLRPAELLRARGERQAKRI